MGLREDLFSKVTQILRERWTTRQGAVVPDPEDLGLGNDGVVLDGTVFYADLSGSTKMVDNSSAVSAAEVYKCYLHSAAQIIRHFNGSITAYDGDRVMAVFLGDAKNTNAVHCALTLNWAVQELIQPAILKQYPKTSFVLHQVAGIDTSPLLVARIGVRGDNDLVWVGRSANYAAKLTELDSEYPTWITEAVFTAMNNSVKFTNNAPMWEARSWTAMNNLLIYRSSWRWPL